MEPEKLEGRGESESREFSQRQSWDKEFRSLSQRGESDMRRDWESEMRV